MGSNYFGPTIEDLVTAAQTVLGEARAEPFEGQLAVAYVIVNRWRRPARFHSNTIWDVCHARLQFSMWNNSSDANLEIVMGIRVTEERFIKALSAVTAAISGTMKDPTQGADHYHTIAKPSYATTWPPRWAPTMTKTVDIGNHRFYRA